MQNFADTLKNLVIGSLVIWLSNILVIVVRMIPVVAIVVVRQGDVQPWLVGITILIILVMVRLGGYLDILKNHQDTTYDSKPLEDDPVAQKIRRFAPFHWASWAAYLIALGLLLIL